MKIKVDQNLYKVLRSYGVEAAIQFAEMRAIESFKLQKMSITPELLDHVSKNAVAEVKEITGSFRKGNLSVTLVKLFEAESKKEALKIIKTELVLGQEEFVELIGNAHLYGFIHKRKHKEFIPDDLKTFNPMAMGRFDPVTKEPTKEAKKAFNQIGEIFDKRRQLNVHWFQFGFEWHCFYFDFGDLLKSHWKAGDHIHYLSHHWGISADKIWNGFEKPGFSPGDHVRYQHDLRERHNPFKKSEPTESK